MKKIKYFRSDGSEVEFFDHKCLKCKSENIEKIDYPISESGTDLGVVWRCKDCKAKFYTSYWYGPPTVVPS